MINSIGFKNFRRFTDFPTIDLGDITILVGGNNAGKSTLVKAMLLMRDFLTTRIERVDRSNNIFKSFRPQFSFSAEHVNIGEFYRAFCRLSPAIENTISFTMKVDKFCFNVNVSGERRPGFLPEVSLIDVSDDDRDISFTFDFVKNQMTVRFGYDNKALNEEFISAEAKLADRSKTLEEYRAKLSKSKDLAEITNLKKDIDKLEKENKQLSQMLGIRISEEESVSIEIKGFVRYSEIGTLGDKRSKEYKEAETKKNFLRGKAVIIGEIARELDLILNKQVIEYIYAHSVCQDSMIAQCANSSDYTKRTIHEFYTSRISKGDDEFSMLERWLEEFGIGKSLKVIPYKGDAYSITIFDDDTPEITDVNKKEYPGGIDLADKGMGSIQLVILLLRLATLIRKYRGQALTVLLEEPEQNLHPAVQSKLADLIHDINNDFKVSFIIETHSEYLVRHTQVLAAKIFKNGFHILPFKVLYLTGDDKRPYNDMGFQKNGKFEKEFGPGFFNVADDAAMELFDLDDDAL